MNRATLLIVSCSFVWGACGGDDPEPLGGSTPGAELGEARGMGAEAFELGEVSQAFVPGEIFTFENESTNDGAEMCIGVDGGNTSVGARLKLFECDGSDNQRWQSTAATDLINSAYENVEARGLCMGIAGGSNTAGADIALLDCESTPGQTWFFAGSTAEFFNIFNSGADPLLCIGIDGGGPVVGAQLKQFECDFDAADQHWR